MLFTSDVTNEGKVFAELIAQAVAELESALRKTYSQEEHGTFNAHIAATSCVILGDVIVNIMLDNAPTVDKGLIAVAKVCDQITYTAPMIAILREIEKQKRRKK